MDIAGGAVILRGMDRDFDIVVAGGGLNGPALALALALRLALALVTEGYPYDMSCFVAWGDKLAAQGPAAFYSEGYFADYPPGYL